MFERLVYIGAENAFERGAIGTHMRGIVNAFHNSGRFKITFIGGKYHDEINDGGINADEMYILSVKKSSSMAGRMAACLRYSYRIIKTLKNIMRDNSDFYVYTRYSLYTTPVILTFLKKHGIKTILEYNDITTDVLLFEKNLKQSYSAGKFIRTSNLTIKTIQKLETYSFKKAGLIVTMTEGLRRYIHSLAPNANVIVAHNATDIANINYTRGVNKKALREKLNLPAKYFYICYIGTITWWDGLGTLLEAIASLKHYEDIRLIMIGYGADLKLVQDTVKNLGLTDTVVFHPAMPFKQAYDYLIASDLVPVIKLIDTYEYTPIKYYEAMASATPIIANDILYINEVGKHRWGKVVPHPPTAKDMADAIEHFYKMRDSLDLMKAEILNYAETFHTWDKRAGSIISAMKELTQK
ncbi:glycosyltransferase [Candidatus Magnetomonas plexicatena]|uniref:glycosyltransferase n=1 Tax=Candidatus Magnetomonas plexicatena TaxID=2552947 RepID=UPI0010FFEE82|nr:glycosyltransferase family 4 protein [Nitrospirales bacterium LBB_01]